MCEEEEQKQKSQEEEDRDALMKMRRPLFTSQGFSYIAQNDSLADQVGVAFLSQAFNDFAYTVRCVGSTVTMTVSHSRTLGAISVFILYMSA